MKFCTRHWGLLRAAIDEKGLGALVAEDGEEAARRMAREAVAGPSIDSFDPLMYAHADIVAHAVNLMGPIVLSDEGQPCPVCRCAAACSCPRPDCTDSWIGVAADHAVEEWNELGEAR